VRLVGRDPAALGDVLDRISTLPQLWQAARSGRHLVI
jgi:hypothetical protein